MNSMTYKGYFAKINFDERDSIFWGKVIGIKDSITFEGETVPQLTEDFKLTLRVSPGIHAEIAAAAAQAGKSLNKWLSDTLDQVVHSH
ncbi:MAG: type II toxin-antitoxin system HicB family antitoxin [Deltaproteobacteria bacterium]|nr:type II toxin-antitoxin system HicB family antitoxin [Deltaproteobacteria bacterium]